MAEEPGRPERRPVVDPAGPATGLPDQHRRPIPPPMRREVRGVWVLELAGTPVARGVLAGLAGGDPAARLTREAKAALDRH